MHKIMRLFVTLKHWQLFIVLITTISLSFVLDQYQAVKSILGVISVITMFLWILSIGLMLNSSPDNPYRFRKKLFLISIILCIMGFSLTYTVPLLSEKYPKIELITLVPILPFTLFGIAYTFYNVPISMVSFQQRRKVGFGKCIGYALLLFYAPIGLWLIQPKINNIDKIINK